MRKKTSKFLLFFIMSSYSMAATFCLTNHQSAIKASQSLKQLLIKGEDVLIDRRTNCIEVAVKEYRSNLISKYLKMNYSLRSSTPMSQISRRMCKFKLRKVGKKKAKGSELSLGSTNNVKVSFENDRVLSTSELIVMEGKLGSLSFNNEKVFFKCDISGKVTHVDFSLDRVNSLGISSSVELTPGQWLNVGSIKNNLEDKKKRLDSGSGITQTKVDSKEHFDYYITVY